MANFAGRRAPNVSQYLANLNVIPSEHDQQQDDGYNIDDDLALFTNTDFSFSDLPESMNSTNSSAGDHAGISENKGGYGDFNGNGSRDAPNEGLDFLSVDYPFGGTPFIPDAPHHGLAPAAYSQDLTSYTYRTATPHLDTVPYTSPQSQSSHSFPPGQKASPTADSTEEAARLAAEEDKRRRNTAASARFRVKKKQREQTLEKTVKELTDKVTALEQKCDLLQQEKGFLRSLVLEKKGEDELAEEYQKFRRESEEAEDGGRSTEGKKKGVGTKAAKA